MGNVPANRAGLVQDFTSKQLAVYEPHCKPDPNHTLDKWGVIGGLIGSKVGFISDQETLKSVVEADNECIAECLDIGRPTADIHQLLGFSLAWLLMTPETRLSIRSEYPEGCVERWEKCIGVDPAGITFTRKDHCCSQLCPFWKEFETDRGCTDILPCGFQNHTTFTVTDNKTGREIVFSDLTVHLIHSHGFYEGNVPFRVDPKKIIEFLQIELK